MDGRAPRIDVGETLRRLGRHALFEHVEPGRRQLLEITLRRLGRGRRPADDQVPQHRGRRVNVGGRCDLGVGVALLGRLVARRAANHRRVDAASGEILGDAEIAEKNAFVGVYQVDPGNARRLHAAGPGYAAPGKLKQDIGRFDVAMHDPGLVQRGETVGERIDQRQNILRIGRRGVAIILQTRLERAPIGEIHDEVGTAVVEPADVVDRDHMGRADAPEQARFVEKAQPDLLVVGQHAVQYLDRDE